MSTDNDRIIPPGHFGSPFAEPSLSMRGPGESELPLALSLEHEPSVPPGFFASMALSGGTDISAALARAAELFPPSRLDKHLIVITDGDPLADLPEGERPQTLADLIASLKPGESLVCLDQFDAQPDALGLNCKPLVISGNGLSPVPSASELVKRACATVDGAEVAVRDKCCGCGGCDKKES